MLSEAANGLRRNASMVVSVVLVTFISLTFVGTAALLQLQIAQMKNYWYDRAQVAVYLCTAVSTAAGLHRRRGDRGAEGRRRGAARLRHARAVHRRVLLRGPRAGVRELPGAVQGHPGRRLRDARGAQRDVLGEPRRPVAGRRCIVESLAGLAGVEQVVDQRRYLDQIFDVLNAASYTAIAIAAIMLVAAALLIATTIRLSAFSRRRELGIMRLVGASNRFIQTPFVLEGVFAGADRLAARGRGGGRDRAVLRAGLPRARACRSRSSTSPTRCIVVPLLIVVGVLLAAVSAGIAITRYLRV